MYNKLSSSEAAVIKREFGDYAYGASVIPEEDDDHFTLVRYGWLQDCNGYRLELKEGKNMTSPACKIILNVVDPDISTEFYTNIFGWKLYRRRSHVVSIPADTSINVIVGDEENEEQGTMIELVYRFSTDSIEHGHALKQICLKASDLKSVVNRLKEKSVVRML